MADVTLDWRYVNSISCEPGSPATIISNIGTNCQPSYIYSDHTDCSGYAHVYFGDEIEKNIKITRDATKALKKWVNDEKEAAEMKKEEKKEKGIKVDPEIKIKKVIFSPPVTVVLFDDGSKSIVRVQEGDTYDPEKGLALAFMRRMLTPKEYHKWLEEARVKNIPINEEARSNGV